MKKICIGIAALVAVFATQASAADMAVKAPPPPPPIVFSWTGIYLGATVGGMWGGWSYTNVPAAFISATNPVQGWVGGGTVGANWQTGPVVLGVEGDWSWSNAQATDLSGCSAPGCREVYPWFATARGRVGYAVDRVLFYVTGGGAWIRSETTFLPTGANDGRADLTGWTVGGGAEWAFWQRWSAKAEYLYLDFGDPIIFNPAIATPLVHHDRNLNIFRVGLNYSFGVPIGPIATK